MDAIFEGRVYKKTFSFMKSTDDEIRERAMQNEGSNEYLEPLSLDKQKVGVKQLNRGSQTKLELLQMEKAKDDLVQLNKELSALKNDFSFLKEVTTFDYKTHIREKAEDMQYKFSQQFQYLEKRYNQQIETLRNAFRQQLNDSLSSIKTEYKKNLANLLKEEQEKNEETIRSLNDKLKLIYNECRFSDIKFECLKKHIGEHTVNNLLSVACLNSKFPTLMAKSGETSSKSSKISVMDEFFKEDEVYKLVSELAKVKLELYDKNKRLSKIDSSRETKISTSSSTTLLFQVERQKKKIENLGSTIDELNLKSDRSEETETDRSETETYKLDPKKSQPATRINKEITEESKSGSFASEARIDRSGARTNKSEAKLGNSESRVDGSETRLCKSEEKPKLFVSETKIKGIKSNSEEMSNVEIMRDELKEMEDSELISFDMKTETNESKIIDKASEICESKKGEKERKSGKLKTKKDKSTEVSFEKVHSKKDDDGSLNDKKRIKELEEEVKRLQNLLYQAREKNFKKTIHLQSQKSERDLQEEFCSSENNLTHSAKVWQKKFSVLQRSLFVLKDEMYLRHTLQRQAAALHQASVSYATDTPVGILTGKDTGNATLTSFQKLHHIPKCPKNGEKNYISYSVSVPSGHGAFFPSAENQILSEEEALDLYADVIPFSSETGRLEVVDRENQQNV